MSHTVTSKLFPDSGSSNTGGDTAHPEAISAVTRTFALLPAALGCFLLISVGTVEASEEDALTLHARFKFSGVFEPTSIDTNSDGFGAASSTEEIRGKLRRTSQGGGRFRPIDLVRQSKLQEYAITNPGHDCFRVNEADFSVEENAYVGPLFQLVDPIRTEPVASNPLLVPYRSENWTP